MKDSDLYEDAIATPYGDVPVTKLPADEQAALRRAKFRKGEFAFDMRYRRSKEAQAVVEAVLERKRLEWEAG